MVADDGCLIDDVVPYDPGNGCQRSEFPAKRTKNLNFFETLKIGLTPEISGFWIDAWNLVPAAELGMFI